eukprot:gene27726-36544_t
MKTRGKKSANIGTAKNRRQNRATELHLDENDTHPPSETVDADSETTDDAKLVTECLQARDRHARAMVAMHQLGDDGAPQQEEAAGHAAIAEMESAEQAIAHTGQALQSYWESLAPEKATELEGRFTAAQDLLILLTTDRAAATVLARAATQEHAEATGADPPVSLPALMAAHAKATGAAHILSMRAQAVVDFFKAREAASAPGAAPKKKKRVKKPP